MSSFAAQRPRQLTTDVHLLGALRFFAAFIRIDKMEQLVRYEVHLDRKLERMLAMLLRLKDLRHGTNGG